VNHESGDTIILHLHFKDELKKSKPFIKPFIESLMKNSVIQDIITSINKGFNLGFVPVLIEFGVSGSYFIRNSKKQNVVKILLKSGDFQAFR
jgi:hypothetical protein